MASIQTIERLRKELDALSPEDRNLVLQNIVKKKHDGDWNCNKCGNLNFSYRLQCNSCSVVRKRVRFADDTFK